MLNIVRFQPGHWLLMRPQEQSLAFSLYDSGGWKAVDAADLPESSRFSRHVLLLPDDRCAFRNRDFPFDLLSAAELDEAVALDMELWNPFNEPCDSLYFVQKTDAAWRVAVWLWPKKLTEALMAMLPAQLACTHVLPQMAWFSACLRVASSALLIQTTQAQQFYALVSADGVPLAMADVRGEAEARRYCRSVCTEVNDDSIFIVGEQAPFYCAAQAQPLPQGLPRMELLARGRLPGVMDWTDPVAWKRPLLSLLMMALLWLAGDAAVLTLRADAIHADLADAKAAASQVLDERDKVASMQNRLLHIHAFQRQQLMPEQLISRLGEVIPKDIWLNMIQMKGRSVDLSGKGKDVARLAVLLESIEGVEKVFLVGDIRPDARSALEIFQLRLQLAGGEKQ
ncbi:PilN domain-containing protein [Mariprofundus ferrooxydans]|nr:PilN domain-containing protein [Mariprofundus ferrooxydans]